MLEATESVAIRLAIGPSPRRIELPAGYRPAPGVGCTLREGADAMLVSYGPVMLHEALTAAELLAGRGIEAAVVAMPWLDRVDDDWLADTFVGVRDVLVVEDHAPVGALGDTLRRALATLPDPPALSVAGVEGWPACGTPGEALRYHGLDGASLADRVALAATGSRRRVTAKPVWVVVADPLTARTFFDCGIVERLRRAARRPAARRVHVPARRRRASGRRGCPPVSRRSTSTTSTRSPSRLPSASRAASTDGWTSGSATTRSRSASTCATASTRERMHPGHRNQLLDSSRVGPLPGAPADRAGDAALALLASAPRRERRSGDGSRRERPDIVLSNLQMQSATPFIVLGRRLGLTTVGYVASWDHTVGKGVIWNGLDGYVVQNDADARRPRPLPRRRRAGGSS